MCGCTIHLATGNLTGASGARKSRQSSLVSWTHDLTDLAVQSHTNGQEEPVSFTARFLFEWWRLDVVKSSIQRIKMTEGKVQE